jgi:DNA-binding protein
MDFEQQLSRALAPCDPRPELWSSVLARASAAAGSIPGRTRRYASRRLTVLGGCVVLAAAAALLIWRFEATPSSMPSSAETAARRTVPEPMPELANSAQPGAGEVSAKDVAQASTGALPASGLPLLPRPVRKPPDSTQSMLALQKVVERHPEMVDGPEIPDSPDPVTRQMFIAAIAMRADGKVISSAVQLVPTARFGEVDSQLQRTLPDEGDTIGFVGFAKDLPLSDGRRLRASVELHAKIVADGYDATRSDVRVREILGHRYDDLLLPVTGDEINQLAVLLSADGRIQREKVQHLDMYNMAAVLGQVSNTGSNTSDLLVAQLGVDPAQLGAVGVTMLEAGESKLVTEPNGESRPGGDRRALIVLYAWPRNDNEPASARREVRRSAEESGINTSAALAIVERMIPDAFTGPGYDLAAGLPTVVLTRRGEVIRAGRIPLRNGVDFRSQVRDQLVPGASIDSTAIRSVKLTNQAGASAGVILVWVNKE